MKVYNNISEFGKVNNATVTIGTFDGVHLGHRKILSQLNRAAAQIDGETVLLTFYPHPRKVLQPGVNLEMLNTQSEKIRQLEKAGIQHLIIHPFTAEFSRTESIDYVREILVNQLHTKKLVIGYDHRFGKNREGSFEYLQELARIYEFEVEEISALDIEDTNVSSTKIRKALKNGNPEKANTYLGYTYSITGTVVKGKKLGRTFGFPTANIHVDYPDKLIPGKGVYAVKVNVEGTEYNGMLNIGQNPTVSGEKTQKIEVHLFDFEADLYNKKITTSFIERIRDEVKFDDSQQLVEQLKLDQNRAKFILSV